MNFFDRRIASAYKRILLRRYEHSPLVHYFTHMDFPGLQAEDYRFRSSIGHDLQGVFYSYEGYDPTRLVVFDHGLGAGHLPYMKEIERLCRAGYRVFTYDHTGCVTSGGSSVRGLSQSLCDLNDCLRALKDDTEVDTGDISVVGHSWGGYSTMNIAAFHPDVRRLVVLSGFVSVKQMLKQLFPHILKPCRRAVLQLETDMNPSYVGKDGISTLQNTAAQVLLMYSENDATVKKAYHYDVLHRALSGKKNVRFLLVPGKNHNPNYTEDAVRYLATLAPALRRTKGLSASEEITAFKAGFDWNRMTAQDEAVWKEILAFLYS